MYTRPSNTLLTISHQPSDHIQRTVMISPLRDLATTVYLGAPEEHIHANHMPRRFFDGTSSWFGCSIGNSRPEACRWYNSNFLCCRMCLPSILSNCIIHQDDILGHFLQRNMWFVCSPNGITVAVPRNDRCIYMHIWVPVDHFDMRFTTENSLGRMVRRLNKRQ